MSGDVFSVEALMQAYATLRDAKPQPVLMPSDCYFIPVQDVYREGQSLYDGEVGVIGGIRFNKWSKEFMREWRRQQAYARRTKHIRERVHRLKGRRG